MRPLELKLEGFKSYRFPQTFDFESRTLFGIVGPTGSGKSSILEGLIFGLYGKTPSARSETKKLINSQAEQARIQLTFEADDVAWEVVRIIRSKGTSQTVLRRIDGVGDPVTGDRAVTDRIEEIVGLDFESFCSSVSLPQGDFDRFLKATPTERSRILKGIFRLERVDLLRDAAKARWQLIEGQIVGLKSTLETFPEQPEAQLQQTQAQELAARNLQEEIRRELPKVLQAELAVERSSEDLKRIDRERSQTEAALLKLPAEETLRGLSDQSDLAERKLEAARAALAGAARELAKAEAAEAEANQETGGDAWFTAAESGLSAVRRLEQLLASRSREELKLQEQFESAAALLPQLKAAYEAAEAGVAEARGDLQRFQQQHAAHLLRSDLAEGQPCPVCDQPVAVVPGSSPLPVLGTAQETLRAAEAGFKVAQREHDRAIRDKAVAQERLRLAGEGIREHRAELEEARGRLSELAPDIRDLSAELTARRAILAGARDTLATARTARDAADAQERQARRDVDELALKAADVGRLLSHTCGLLGIESASTDGEGLWAAAKRVLEAGTARLELLAQETASLQRSAAAAVRAVQDFRTRFSASADDQAADILARARSEVTRLELKVLELKTGMQKRRDVESQLAALLERRGRFDRLVADFTDSKFTAYLLDEQRRLLSRIGSEKLRELTGHYTFDDLGQFQVVDERTGVTRSPDTLSGGETFLASLSLALALSEAVALEGGRLGCFFLDEGFGSLDQESLDLALEGIETLAAPGRLIGLISHVPGVQARLDDLIMLERAADGSTEVAQHEGPIGYASMLM